MLGRVSYSLFKTILNIATKVVEILIYPLTAVVNTLFPDISSATTSVTTFLNNTLVPLFAWFGNLIPPITKSLLLIWLGFLVIYYSAVLTFTLGKKLFVIIKKIKFW